MLGLIGTLFAFIVVLLGCIAAEVPPTVDLDSPPRMMVDDPEYCRPRHHVRPARDAEGGQMVYGEGGSVIFVPDED